MSAYSRLQALQVNERAYERQDRLSYDTESFDKNVSDTYLDTDSYEYNQMWYIWVYPPNGGFFFYL